MRALVFRHDPGIGLGNLEATLRAAGYEIETLDVAEEPGRLAELDATAPDLLVVLGGEEGAYETERYPYLAEELRIIRERADAAAPVFGVCLGAQLTAAALGARVFRGSARELGWVEVVPTDAGAASPVRHFAGVPVTQWHGDHFELPDGVELLASSAAYPNQAFRRGRELLAVQFHPEVDRAIHEGWIERWGGGLRPGEPSVDELVDGRERHLADAEAASAALLGEWLAELPAAARDAAA